MRRLLPRPAADIQLLSACSGKDKAPESGEGDGVAVSRALWGQNLTLNATGHPQAEISAKGDFIVGGKKVEVSDTQRTLLVAYHRELGGIADAGMQWLSRPQPTPLPVQALDHATGYLMAAAVVRGLIARATEQRTANE